MEWKALFITVCCKNRFETKTLSENELRQLKLERVLEKENQNAIVLVDGYEWGMEFLRFKNFERGKFFLNKSSDLENYGGALEKNDDGDFDFLKIGRST